MSRRQHWNVLAALAAALLLSWPVEGWAQSVPPDDEAERARLEKARALPGVIVDAPEGAVQTAAFEIEGDVIRALYVVRNLDKLRHLAAPSQPHESDRG